MQRPTTFLLVAFTLASSACSGGEDPASGGSGLSASEITTVETTTSTTTDTSTTSTTDTPTTGVPETTTTTTSTTTSTTDEPTSTTGPICEPGEVHCVCDGGECSEGLTCVDDVCVAGLACEDEVGEPDDTEPTAQDLGETDDDDDHTLMAAGVLSGADDVDWFTYKALDTFGHVAEPTIKVTSSASVRVCQFLECIDGGAAKTEVTCPEGTQSALSGALRPGCCGGATFTVKDFNCPGSSDDLRVFVRLDKPSQDECVEYSFVAHN